MTAPLRIVSPQQQLWRTASRTPRSQRDRTRVLLVAAAAWSLLLLLGLVLTFG